MGIDGVPRLTLSNVVGGRKKTAAALGVARYNPNRSTAINVRKGRFNVLQLVYFYQNLVQSSNRNFAYVHL